MPGKKSVKKEVESDQSDSSLVSFDKTVQDAIDGVVRKVKQKKEKVRVLPSSSFNILLNSTITNFKFPISQYHLSFFVLTCEIWFIPEKIHSGSLVYTGKDPFRIFGLLRKRSIPDLSHLKYGEII